MNVVAEVRSGLFEERISCLEHGTVRVLSYKGVCGYRKGECPHCREVREDREEKEALAAAEANRLMKEIERKEQEAEYNSPENVLARQLVEAGVPAIHSESSLNNYTPNAENPENLQMQKELLLAAIRVAHGQVMNLLCVGSPGVGKTHIGVGIIREVLQRGKTARYVKEGQILRELKATFSKRSQENEQDVINRFASYDLLVIDEIGWQSGSEYNTQAISDLIDDRWNNRKQTIVLGNISEEQLRIHFTESTISRLTYRGESFGIQGLDVRRFA